MNGDAYVGVDLGTSGCRAVAIDRDGCVRARSQVPLPAPQRRGEHSEQDPEIWWSAVRRSLRDMAHRLTGTGIRAIAVDGTSATLLVTDVRGAPLAPALMYNDARARAQAAEVRRHAPPDTAAHGATSAIAKLMWLAGHIDVHAVHHALHQADWIAGRLCGRWGVSDQNNALKLGYDPVGRQWPDWIQGLGIPRHWLPDVIAPGTVTGPVDPIVARDLGLPSDMQVVAGTTDGVAGFIATGARAPGDAVTSLGSTLVLKVVSGHPVFEPRHGVYSHRLGELWLAGGASNSGGAVLDRYFSRQALAAMTPALRPDTPTGLDYYPLLRPGERFPVCDPALEPVLQPRPLEPERFLQAMLEGIAHIEQQGYLLLQRLGAPFPRRVLTVGGGAANPAWTAIRRNCLGVDVVAAEHTDAAYGAAMLARDGIMALPHLLQEV